jgi:hypothetical protein
MSLFTDFVSGDNEHGFDIPFEEIPDHFMETMKVPFVYDQDRYPEFTRALQLVCGKYMLNIMAIETDINCALIRSYRSLSDDFIEPHWSLHTQDTGEGGIVWWMPLSHKARIILRLLFDTHAGVTAFTDATCLPHAMHRVMRLFRHSLFTENGSIYHVKQFDDYPTFDRCTEPYLDAEKLHYFSFARTRLSGVAVVSTRTGPEQLTYAATFAVAFFFAKLVAMDNEIPYRCWRGFFETVVHYLMARPALSVASTGLSASHSTHVEWICVARGTALCLSRFFDGIVTGCSSKPGNSYVTRFLRDLWARLTHIEASLESALQEGPSSAWRLRSVDEVSRGAAQCSLYNSFRHLQLKNSGAIDPECFQESWSELKGVSQLELELTVEFVGISGLTEFPDCTSIVDSAGDNKVIFYGKPSYELSYLSLLHGILSTEIPLRPLLFTPLIPSRDDIKTLLRSWWDVNSDFEVTTLTADLRDYLYPLVGLLPSLHYAFCATLLVRLHATQSVSLKRRDADARYYRRKRTRKGDTDTMVLSGSEALEMLRDLLRRLSTERDTSGVTASIENLGRAVSLRTSRLEWQPEDNFKHYYAPMDLIEVPSFQCVFDTFQEFYTWVCIELYVREVSFDPQVTRFITVWLSHGLFVAMRQNSLMIPIAYDNKKRYYVGDVIATRASKHNHTTWGDEAISAYRYWKNNVDLDTVKQEAARTRTRPSVQEMPDEVDQEISPVKIPKKHSGPYVSFMDDDSDDEKLTCPMSPVYGAVTVEECEDEELIEPPSPVYGKTTPDPSMSPSVSSSSSRLAQKRKKRKKPKKRAKTEHF